MKLYANSKPFSQVINPFQLDQTFSVHGDNWNLRCDWLHEKSGFEFKVRILDLAIEREMQNGFHPHHLRNPSPNYDFMDFLCTFLVGKAKKAKKKKTLFIRTVFFFFCLLCVRLRDNCSLKNSSNFFLVSPKKKRKKGKPSTGLSSLKSVFRLASFDSNFKTPSPDFPIEYAGLLSLEVSDEFSWQWLLLSLYTLTHFLC